MLDIYGTLEIKSILEEVASFSHSEIAKTRILELKMLSSKSEVKQELAILDEMLSCELRHGKLPINVSFDIAKYIDMARKGGILTPLDLDHVANDVLVCNALFGYLGKIEPHLYPLILKLGNELQDISSLERAIHKAISPNLSFYDNASEELGRIRRQILKLEGSIRGMTSELINRYKDSLSETTITIRNDHFVLPVKSSEKNKVPGVIHDVSDSGQTTFIEPNILVDLSNQLYLLHKEEKEEITRILKELSMKVVELAPQIISNNKIIAELDFISSKAEYGNTHNSFVSIVSDEPVIDIKGARHPLIDQEKVVENDFLLNANQRLIIISGPNAGGKTVALKTLGLMVMMNQMGLALPTSTPATLSFFPRIYADIGDNQSLSDNLSTFAAHVSNLSTITHFVKSDDLVLLDELGTGTSPAEGEAIAIAISDFLLEKKVFGMISSHFEEMKEYAFRRDNVSNAMMVFDEQKLLPTYKFQIGYPGRSYGLEMAKRYHLDDNVIANAKNNLNKSKKRSVNDVLDKLNAVLRQNEALKEDLSKREKALLIKEKDFNYQTKVLQKKRDNLMEDVKDEKQKLIEEAKEEITKILRVISDPNSKQKDLVSAKKYLEKMEEGLEPEEEIVEEAPIKIGDYVEHRELGLVGKLVSIKGNKAEIITNDGMNVKTSFEKLTHADEPDNRLMNTRNVDQMVNANVSVGLELNVIGYHTDEGVEAVAKYLDSCRLKNLTQVRIIHGMGTGALRTAIWNYLKKCNFIKEYHYGGYYDGGTGATIVIFK